MSILSAIAGKKRERLYAARTQAPLADLRSRISDIEPARDFPAAVRRGEGPIRFITEIKKGSPSRGVIRERFDPLAIARIYEEKAVDAISVITEEDFFSGSLRYLAPVRQVTTRPLLRKDFLIDEYQIYESRASGADAVLLIAALLSRSQAGEYLHLCRELGLGVLFEVHDHEELETAMLVNAGIIGINNRSLKTLKVDIETTFILKQEITGDRIVVSESGIKIRDDVLRVSDAGIDAVLVGTSLMESPDIGRKLDELRGNLQARSAANAYIKEDP